MAVLVEGAAQLRTTLHAAAAGMATMDGANPDVASLIAAAVQPPRRTGRLAASVSSSSGPGAAVVSVGAPYAGFVEYGTRHMRGRHYLQRAVEETQPRWMDLYAAESQRLLDDVRGA
jgi:HK97 gp10 family phage protein